MIRIFQNTHQGGIHFVPAVVEEAVDGIVTAISVE
jgi:hypothetical protein